MTMPEAVWDALDRAPATFRLIKHSQTGQLALPDYPDKAEGLKVSEIKDVIEAEGKRASSSDNISPQIQQIIGDLRYEGKIGRNDEDRRYFIIGKKTTLYGPPLNADGSPMTEQEDGTFLKDDNTVFTDTDGKAIKKRVRRNPK